MNYNDFMNLVTVRLRDYPSERYGQAVYNVAAIQFPDRVGIIAGSKIDCFYDDSNLGSFLTAIGLEY